MKTQHFKRKSLTSATNAVLLCLPGVKRAGNGKPVGFTAIQKANAQSLAELDLLIADMRNAQAALPKVTEDGRLTLPARQIQQLIGQRANIFSRLFPEKTKRPGSLW